MLKSVKMKIFGNVVEVPLPEDWWADSEDDMRINFQEYSEDVVSCSPPGWPADNPAAVFLVCEGNEALQKNCEFVWD